MGYGDSLQRPKDALPHGEHLSNKIGTNSPDLLYGIRTPESFHEMIASLPPRDVVDRLLSWFFASVDLAPSEFDQDFFMDLI